MSTLQQSVHYGIVKNVLSGDAMVVRGKPKGGPPPERTVCLSNVTAPRLARRPIPGQDMNPADVTDQPYAWESREFLRKKVVGKEICFTVEYKAPGSGREYGCVYLGRDENAESLTETMVSEGLVELRRGGIKQTDENQQKLVQLEETAKAGFKGKWAPPEEQSKHVRKVEWSLDNPRHFVSSHHQKPIEAVIEHVRDCCTVRAFLLPSFQYVTVMLTGIKGPMFKLEDDKTVPEQFAEESRYYTESRLLQRDVKIVLEGTSGQSNLLGTIQHPNGNISELLLKEGFAHCADWSIANYSEGPKVLRDAEKIAKDKKLRRWVEYTAQAVNESKENLTAKVVEVVNGDSLVVKQNDGTLRKIFLASIRCPKLDKPLDDIKRDPRSRPRPLYDIPYMFEAREFLRKKLIGKKVNVQVDYIQPKTDDFPEKTCCTVTLANINLAEALISKGLGTVVRYRQDDVKRSSQYDQLLQAEFRAQNKAVGVHSKKEPPVIRVAEVSGDANKAKQFLPFLQRAGRVEGTVEFVASGSRLRLYIPRETCIITFLLAGIECPRGSRPIPGGGGMVPADPYGQESQQYTKELSLQREVEVEVESMDKGGNFIGWMYLDGLNLSVSLVEEGLAKVHFTAEKSNYYKTLTDAEERAKKAGKNLWADFEEPKETVSENEPQERNVEYKTVIVTEVTEELHIFAQTMETGSQLESMMEKLRADLNATPPVSGAFTPKRGELCAAKFVDNEWYRARVERVSGKNVVSVLYVDYGNAEVSDIGRLAALPAAFQSIPPYAHKYGLACVGLPKDEEDVKIAIDAVYNDIYNKQVSLNVEYKNSGLECVSLLYPDSKDDILQGLISEGLVLFENRREKRLAKLVSTYQKAHEKAKKDRLNLWRYGDFTEDDAREFGYQAK